MSTETLTARRRVIRRALREGIDTHAAYQRRKAQTGSYISPASQQLLDASKRFTGAEAIQRSEDEMLDMLRALYNYGCHSWCASTKWRYWVAGLLCQGYE